MTLFEYLAIAFSLVLSTSAMRLVGGLPHAMHPTRRYWVHLAALVLTLANIAIMFWAFWSYREASWNLAKFVFALAQLGAVYFIAATLVPENASEVASWRDHYYAARVRLFGTMIVLSFMIAANTTLLVDMPLTHPDRVVQLCMLVFGGIGVSTSNPRVHAALVILSSIFAATLATSVFLNPSSLLQ